MPLPPNDDMHGYNGGVVSGGANANYGGSGGAYNGEVSRQTGNVNGAWDQNANARGSQQDALSLAQSAAMGNQPSAAEYQMRQGLGDAARQQMAMAASARGPSGLAMGQYNAAANTGAMQQQGVNQAAQLRAQEMAQARGQYLQGAQGLRGQDLSQAMGQEGLLQNTQSAQLQAQANAAQLAERQWEAQSKMDEEAARAQEGMAGNIAGGVVSAIGSIVSDETMKTSIVPLQNDVSPESMRYTGGGGITRAPIISLGVQNPDTGTHVGVPQPLDRAQDVFVSAPEAAPTAAPAFAAPPPAAAPPEAVPVDRLGNAFGALGRSLQGGGRSLDMPAYQPQNFTIQRPMQISDERQKTSLNPQEAAPAQMMDKLRPYSYEYKQSTGLSPGRHYGIMAQDLEQSPMGASAVRQTPRGKAIDVAESTGLHFANESNLHQRLKAIEDKLGR